MPNKDATIVDEIVHLKRQDPFVPFQVVMTSGDRHRVENPDALAVGASQLHYYPSSGMGIHMRMNQITAVEVESGQ